MVLEGATCWHVICCKRTWRWAKASAEGWAVERSDPFLLEDQHLSDTVQLEHMIGAGWILSVRLRIQQPLWLRHHGAADIKAAEWMISPQGAAWLNLITLHKGLSYFHNICTSWSVSRCGDCMQAVNLRWSNLYGLDLLSQKVARAESEPGGPAGLWGQRYGAVHGPRTVTLSDQTPGTHLYHVCQCLLHPAVSNVTLAGCPSPKPSLLCPPPTRPSSLPPLCSPRLPAPTLKKGPPWQISVSNPRWPPTFFNWCGELMCNQLWSGWLPSATQIGGLVASLRKGPLGTRAESQFCSDRHQEGENAVTRYTSHLIYSQYVLSSVIQTNTLDSLRHGTRITCQALQCLTSVQTICDTFSLLN